jgi:VanZ family protein
MHCTAWFPPFGWGLAILIMSGDLGSAHNTLGLVSWLLSHVPSLSPAQVDVLHGLLRKAGHMAAYGTLCFLWFRAFQAYWPERRWPFLALAVLGSLAVAVLDEGRQVMVESRRGSVYDIGWDMAGAGLSTLLILVWHKPRARAEQAKVGDAAPMP